MDPQVIQQAIEQVKEIILWVIGIMTPIIVAQTTAIVILFKAMRRKGERNEEIQKEYAEKVEKLSEGFKSELISLMKDTHEIQEKEVEALTKVFVKQESIFDNIKNMQVKYEELFKRYEDLIK